MSAGKATLVKSGIATVLMVVMGLVAARMPASAGEGMGSDVIVTYADLDINTTAGAEKLYARIQHAAARICPEANSRPLVAFAAVIHCRNAVVNEAVGKVGSPKLTAVYATRAHHAAHSPV